MKQKNYLILLIVSIAIMIVIAVWPYAAETVAVLGNPQTVTSLLRDSGPWGRITLIFLLILQAFLAFIPGQGLMLASGYIYGFWQGLFLTWLGLTLGGQISFWLARRYGRPFAKRFVSEKVITKWDNIAARQGMGFYIISLFLPIFPNDAMCFVAGLGEISFRRFLIANMIGRFIATASMTFVGAYGTQIPRVVWVTLLIAIGIFLLIWKLQKNSFLCPNTNVEV
ncbi:MAG: TVP38/TMEM64 family protein [Anaerolineales bacterium]|jgi:uncharacterized membrane protein YdjX (TVP38/TMEM64 family)